MRWKEGGSPCLTSAAEVESDVLVGVEFDVEILPSSSPFDSLSVGRENCVICTWGETNPNRV